MSRHLAVRKGSELGHYSPSAGQVSGSRRCQLAGPGSAEHWPRNLSFPGEQIMTVFSDATLMRLLGLEGATTDWDAGGGREGSRCIKGLKEGHPVPEGGQEGKEKYYLHQLWDYASRNNRAIFQTVLAWLTPPFLSHLRGA